MLAESRLMTTVRQPHISSFAAVGFLVRVVFVSCLLAILLDLLYAFATEHSRNGTDIENVTQSAGAFAVKL